MYCLHRNSLKLSEMDQWVDCYLNMSEELREIYKLKELYRKWQNESKDEILKAIKTFKNDR